MIFFLAACGNGSGPSSEPGEAGEAASRVAALQAATAGAPGPLPDWADGTPVELSEAEATALGIETVEVELRSMAYRLQAMGQVMPDPYRQAIVSYPFSARIAEIKARVGDWVKTGDPLVVLQSEEVGEATSAFYRANADLELARATHDRQAQLYENGVGARKDFSSAETELRVAEANLNAAEKKLHVLGFSEAQIETLRQTHQILPNITLFSPISGKVVTNSAVLGGMVDQSNEILMIMDPTRLWVEAAVYEKDIARVRAGQQVQVTVPAYPSEVFQGTLTYVSDVLDPETRTITARTEVSNPDLLLKPGMFADLTIELSQNGSTLAVPAAAILADGEWSMVFVPVGEGRFEPRLVIPGAREDGWVEIADGLEAGELVVTTGNFQLKSKLFEAILEAGHIH